MEIGGSARSAVPGHRLWLRRTPLPVIVYGRIIRIIITAGLRNRSSESTEPTGDASIQQKKITHKPTITPETTRDDPFLRKGKPLESGKHTPSILFYSRCRESTSRRSLESFPRSEWSFQTNHRLICRVICVGETSELHHGRDASHRATP